MSGVITKAANESSFCNSESSEEKRCKEKFGKNKLFTVLSIISMLFGCVGVAVLIWSGVSMGAPFQYAIHIGVTLVVTSLVINLVCDKSKWIKGRGNYPDNVGGSGGV